MEDLSGLSNVPEEDPQARQNYASTGAHFTGSFSNGHSAHYSLAYLSSRLETHPSQVKALNYAVYEGEQHFWHADGAQYDDSEPSRFHFSSTPGYLARRATLHYDPVTPLESHQAQARTIPVHGDHEPARWALEYATSVPLGDFLEAYPLLGSPGSSRCPQPSPTDMILWPEGWRQEYHGDPQQPLQQCFLDKANEDPWSPLGYRTNSSPHLAFSHPLNVGYDSFPTKEGVNANIATMLQHETATSRCRNRRQGTGVGYVDAAPGLAGANITFPKVTTPSLLSPGSYLGVVSVPEQQPKDQHRKSNPIPECAQIAWDLKTGEPLVNLRTKRRQTEEERLVSEEVRRLNGPCNPCRIGHRKCHPAHLSPRSGHDSEIGGTTRHAAWAPETPMPQPRQSNETGSQSSRGALAVSQHGSGDLFLPSGLTAENHFLPLETPRTCQTPPSSPSSFSCVTGEPSDLHPRTKKPCGVIATEYAKDDQAAREQGSSTSAQSPPEEARYTIWTPESCSYDPAAELEFGHSSLYLEESNVHSIGHGSSAPLSPVIKGHTNYEGDFALFDRDVVGIGEQFIGFPIETLPFVVRDVP